jgi:hypothetical protein
MPRSAVSQPSATATAREPHGGGPWILGTSRYFGG